MLVSLAASSEARKKEEAYDTAYYYNSGFFSPRLMQEMIARVGWASGLLVSDESTAYGVGLMETRRGGVRGSAGALRGEGAGGPSRWVITVY